MSKVLTMAAPSLYCMTFGFISIALCSLCSIGIASEQEDADKVVRAFCEAVEAGYGWDVRTVVAQGASAVGPTLVYIENQKNPDKIKGLLLNCLKNIQGTESTKALLTCALSNASIPIKMRAEDFLAPRTIDFELSNDQTTTLFNDLQNGTLQRAAAMAAIIGSCTTIPSETGISRILDRLRFEWSVFDEDEDPASMSEETIAVLNQMAASFRHYGRSAQGILIHEYSLAQSKIGSFWLLMARGYAGDPEVTSPIEAIIKSDNRPGLRVVGIHALADSYGPESVPVLLPLLQDPAFVQGYHGAKRPVATAAYIVLHALKKRYGLDLELGPPPR